MGAIIEFLFANPFILIIVIGLIYSMFFRKSPAEKQPGNRPPNRPAGQPNRPASLPNNRMPNFGGSPMLPPKPVRHVPVSQEQPKPAETRTQMQVLIGKAEQHASQAPVNEQVQAGTQQEWTTPYDVPTGNFASPAPSAARAAQGAHSPILPESLTKDDLARAILWAEILGPPRAKRPYRR